MHICTMNGFYRWLFIPFKAINFLYFRRSPLRYPIFIQNQASKLSYKSSFQSPEEPRCVLSHSFCCLFPVPATSLLLFFPQKMLCPEDGCLWFSSNSMLFLRSELVKSLSRVRLFATPWTVVYKTPLSMEFSRQEYWSRLPFPSPISQKELP